MRISDRIYGDFEIIDPLALELIATPAFARLKRVCQLGVPEKYFPSYRGYSRFEHSVGVYLLLNHLGASAEEQIAGLLHDVSHTAFSHVIDWVVGADVRKESYQDNNHLAVLKQPELAAILGRYGLVPETVAAYERFGLLEQPIPSLCADRIDYSLRQMDADQAKHYFGKLIAHNNEIIFSDLDAARDFSNNFLTLQLDCWTGYDAETRYGLLAHLIKKAMGNGDLTFDDLKVDDDHVLAKIFATDKKEYRDIINLLEKNDLSSLPRSDKQEYRKFRYVDPLTITNEETRRLSDLDPVFKKRLAAAREENAKGRHYGTLPR